MRRHVVFRASGGRRREVGGQALLRLSVSVHVSFNTALKFPHWASQQVYMEEEEEEEKGRGGNRGDRGGCCYWQHQQGETVALHCFQFNL